MKLAILEADILYDGLRSGYEGYGRMFRDLLQLSGASWHTSIYPVISGHYPAVPDDYDAYLITGSKYDSFGDDDWIVQLREFVQGLYHKGKPMVGVCFGHQLLAYTLGGKVGRASAGWGLGIMNYQLQSQPAFVGGLESINLIVTHQDQVLALPEQAEPLLSNAFCPHAAFYIQNRVLGIQGHPEFTVDYARALLAYREKQFDADFLTQAKASYDTPHHGEQVGGWIRQFLEEAAKRVS